MNRSGLAVAALIKFVSGLALVALLLFLPAGTWNYPNAWLFIALLFIPMLLVGIILLVSSPELLRKRLNSKEKEPEQKSVILYSVLIFTAGFLLAGFSFRFGWLPLPEWVVISASVLLFIGYLLWAEVMRENAYLSRTVEIQQGQRVVDTGLYGIVRHPMYAAALLIYLSIPLVLCSLLSFVIFLGLIPVLTARIKNEEKVLTEGLEGYSEYMARVKYRLLPYIW